MTDSPRDQDSDRRSTDFGSIGTLFGWTYGPFGAAVGSVVGDDRVAFKAAFGTGADRDGGELDDGRLDDATTIEIEDATTAGEDDAERASSESGDQESETETDSETEPET